MAEEDLVYGKNRHFFGGIEPSNMKAFQATNVRSNGKNSVNLTVTLPDDTVINSQTLCTVGGCVVRRKTGSAPVDEFDGELIGDYKTNGIYKDENVEFDTTYYYAAFPYSKQGVYNRNPANTASATITSAYPPPAMTSFSATTAFSGSTPKVVLSGTVPTKIYDAGDLTTPVGTVDKVVIRRSSTGYPSSETMGVAVGEVTVSGTNANFSFTMDDTSVALNTTYYYTAFPHSSDGVYNYDTTNRATVTIDLGPTPANPKYFSVKRTAVLEQAAAVIDCDLPDRPETNIGVKVVIRRKADSYPATVTDGDQIVTFTESDPAHYSGHHRFIDKGLTDGTTYYYRAFSMTDRGAVNTTYSTTNTKSIVAKEQWVFAVQAYFSSNQKASLTYPSTFQGLTVDNAEFTPAKMDFSSDTFDYGDWDIIPGTLFMPRPCILSDNGQVLCYLNPNDYTQKEDCTPVDVTGNYMMEFPRTYGSNSFMHTVGSYHKFALSNKSGGKLTLAHEPFLYKTNSFGGGWSVPYVYVAIFPGSKSNGRIESKSSATVSYLGSSDTETTLKAAIQTKYSDKWSNILTHDYLYISNLCLLMGKDINTQATFGVGADYTTSARTTGSLNKKGLFYGKSYSSANASTGVKIFGIEDFYGLHPTLTVGAYYENVIEQGDLAFGAAESGSTAKFAALVDFVDRDHPYSHAYRIANGLLTTSDYTKLDDVSSGVKYMYGIARKSGTTYNGLQNGDLGGGYISDSYDMYYNSDSSKHDVQFLYDNLIGWGFIASKKVVYLALENRHVTYIEDGVFGGGCNEGSATTGSCDYMYVDSGIYSLSAIQTLTYSSTQSVKFSNPGFFALGCTPTGSGSTNHLQNGAMTISILSTMNNTMSRLTYADVNRDS